MLDPQSRAALTQLLTPPSGFRLGHAVGTTFTLDLDTALTIPLSFAARRMTAEDDSLGILDAVRRAADRVDIFAQAGYVAIGFPPSDLVAFLEPMIHPVAMNTGVFHPKVWYLEFERDGERAYRFICASRNLTSDTSWDVVVALDGRLANPDQHSATRKVNAPLVDLLTWLPRHTVHPLSSDRHTRINELAERWETVVWDTPQDMRNLRFHVWGVGPRPTPDFSGKRALIMSPFLTDDGVSMLTRDVRVTTHVVSRPESIDALTPRSITTRQRTTSVLSDAASPDQDGNDAQDDTGQLRLAGLHAKTYVFDRLDGAHVFLGSLNATGSAFHRNVEVMVEIVGSVRAFGVEAIREGLGDFLDEYVPSEVLAATDDEKSDRDLSRALARIAATPFHARVTDGNPYSLAYWTESEAIAPADVELSWRPLTRSGLAIAGLPAAEHDPSIIDDLALADISPFIVVSARDARGERSEQRTLVLAHLHDDPAHRHDAIIASHLTDRAAFLRFLMLLLELGGTLPSSGTGGTWALAGNTAAQGVGLFESLMKAVGRGQSGLADVERIVRLLEDQQETDTIPPGFSDLWSAVWSAHTLIEGERRD